MSSSAASDVSAPVAATGALDLDEPAHLVQFYERDAFLLQELTRFVGGGLGAGSAVIVIATKPHLDGLETGLKTLGVDVAVASDQGRYVPLDAVETLTRLMVDGAPDRARFTAIVGGALERAADRHPHVRVFGEMVALLWAEGKGEAALRLEEFWNDLARTLPFSLLCAYPLGAFAHEPDSTPLRKICRAHSHVIPAESYAASASVEERLRAIIELQRKARALDAASSEQSRLAAIVDSSDDAIVGKTLDGVVTSWNRGAERLFGYTAEEMIGQPISRLMPGDCEEDFEMILAAIRRGERVEHYETQRIRKDGRRVDVSLTVSPIRDGSGHVIGASKIARDVTERKQAEEELRRLRGVAEAANRAKDEFLAMLGHELRNPLAMVRNALVTVRLDGDRRERALDIAQRGTDHLTRLVEDLLDVARITQGKITLRRQRVDLAGIVERAIETAQQLVAERGHSLSSSLPRDDVQVDADPMRLEQVIVNLITNAAKYTEPGGRIEVTVECDGPHAVLRVRDNGMGIASETLPYVFDLFAQADRGLDRRHGGLGIGLTIVRQLVERHGGTVEARSDGLGKGAEFVIRLPALPQVKGEPARPARREKMRERGCMRVLVVEDNPDAAEALMLLLEVLGHRVRIAHDGPMALDLARANPPDVMLVDIGLPGMDGYEVARRVRHDPRLKDLVLVALTGYGLESDKRQAMRAGFDHHLTKPVEPDALDRLVRALARSEPKPAVPTFD